MIFRSFAFSGNASWQGDQRLVRACPSRPGLLLALLLALLCTGPGAAWGQSRIKDLATLQGARPNQLVGYGIVAGLDGSGDQTTQTPFTVQSIVSMLGQLGVQLPPGTNLHRDNLGNRRPRPAA
jgi:flagellar P-ring protein precursor FlgI